MLCFGHCTAGRRRRMWRGEEMSGFMQLWEKRQTRDRHDFALSFVFIFTSRVFFVFMSTVPKPERQAIMEGRGAERWKKGVHTRTPCSFRQDGHLGRILRTNGDI